MRRYKLFFSWSVPIWPSFDIQSRGLRRGSLNNEDGRASAMDSIITIVDGEEDTIDLEDSFSQENQDASFVEDLDHWLEECRKPISELVGTSLEWSTVQVGKDKGAGRKAKVRNRGCRGGQRRGHRCTTNLLSQPRFAFSVAISTPAVQYSYTTTWMAPSSQGTSTSASPRWFGSIGMARW